MFTLKGDIGETYGLIPIPKSVKQFLYVDDFERRYIRIENIVKALANSVFENYDIVSSHIVSVVRNMDISTDDYLEDHEQDYRTFMKKILKKRNRLQAV